MSIKLWIHPTEIHCQCTAEEAGKLEGIGDGVNWDGRRKKYIIPFGAHQLKFLKSKFPDLEVIEGIEYIYRFKHSITSLHQGTQTMADAVESDLDVIRNRDFIRPERQPFVHQIDGLFYLRHFEGAALFADCGCLSGRSKVKFNRGGGSREFSLEKAYKRFHNSWDRSIPTFVRSFKGKKIGLQKITDIKQSGIKQTYSVLLENGSALDATEDHEFMTSEGFVALRDLGLSSKIMVDTLTRYGQKKVKKLRVSTSTNRRADGTPEYSRVRDITRKGLEMTYDIVCEDPHRNFVANGMVVHNSGKTGMILWDVENGIAENRISRSSTLIVGKLMTLETGWIDDAKEFTGLSALNLWEPSQSKTINGEQTEIADHGEKPDGKGKSKSKVVFYKKNEDVPVILRSHIDFNPRRHRKMKQKWKEIKIGEDTVKYGKEYIQEFEVINIRTENMKKKIASKEHNIHIINHESLVNFEDELIARRYDYIVIDESTAIKNHRSKAFQSLIKVAAWSKYRRVLSGTPSPQGPQDLWSQFFFLDWGVTFGASHTNFISQNFSIFELTGKDGKFAGRIINPLKPGQKGHIGTFNYVESRLSNRSFRVKLRDCTDLPPLVEMTRTVYLDDVQRKHYNDMEEQMMMELEDGSSIDVTVNVAKVAKLRQITGGFVLNKEKEVKEVSKRNSKLIEFLSLLEEFGPDEKVVIFAEYRAEIAMLLKTLGDSAVAIYGGVSDVKKIEAQKEFVNNPDKKYIVCQPQSAAYGVNGFNKVARYLVFYSLSYQADTIYQAIKRIERTGQVRNMFVYYMIAKDTIDELIYQSTKDKEATQQRTINVDILKALKTRRRNG